jgi:hypothetical protein
MSGNESLETNIAAAKRCIGKPEKIPRITVLLFHQHIAAQNRCADIQGFAAEFSVADV